jgi:hypothetical protein
MQINREKYKSCFNKYKNINCNFYVESRKQIQVIYFVTNLITRLEINQLLRIILKTLYNKKLLMS